MTCQREIWLHIHSTPRADVSLGLRPRDNIDPALVQHNPCCTISWVITITYMVHSNFGGQ